VDQTFLRFLLEDLNADPNVGDDYGRTPLSLFITAGAMSWRSDDEFGSAVIELLFAHGACADVQFTPDYVHIAGRAKWSIMDHLNDRFHGHSQLPPRMKAIFSSAIQPGC
ncbi:ankyrin repeat domain-containing protein, partial [Xanthomonas sp. D-99]|uniref:ankyrin repeat domain-containing protein n=1 Tax=Xanthomonas sp. D-99 TaxID=2821273 RepID=UPI001ADAFBB4